jgi:hypothetical protein
MAQGLGRMSKVFKIAAAAVAVIGLTVLTAGIATGVAGLTFLGASASTLFTISAGLSVGSSLLAKRPKAPSVNAANIDRLNSTIDLRTPRKIVWGNTAGANDVRDQEYTDNQSVLHRFIVVASHKVHSIYEIWFDDELAWSSVSGVASKFAGYLNVTPVTEGNAGNAINISPRMGSSRRYTGLAYVYLRFKLTGNSKKTESPFVQSVPTRVTIRTKGAYVYDPRLDSTVPGGSGPHRANDQSTWEWSDSASRNPALQLLWWMLGWRINGKLAVGGGIPPNRIDMESFITAANLCDEDVSIAAGGTEPRYRSDGVVSEGDSPTVIMDALKAAMNADLDDVGGKLRLFVFHNDLGTPLADFNENDILGSFEYRATAALDESFNVVRGTYTDPRDQALYQQIDYPQVELPSRDGIDRIDTFPLALVQSPSQAQRLAKQRLQRMQFGGVFTATGQATWWKVQKNSVVRLTFAPRGWVNKLFRVAELEHRVDGTVPITLREEANQIYAWDEEESAPVLANNGLGYNRAENPIVIAIDDSGAVIPTPGSPVVSTVRNEFGEPRDPAQLLNSSLLPTQGGRIGYQGQSGFVEVMRLTPRILDAAEATLEKQLDNNIDNLRRAVVLALSQTNGIRTTLSKAGIYEDPANGQIQISAIDQTRERLNQVSIILDAQAATITTKASVNYVDEQIILAVLNPEQAAELGPLITRLTNAETTISGLQASIVTKASVADLNALGGRVTEAELDIDALQGEITLKVDNTTFDELADRVSSAETQLEAIPDAATITNSVSAARYLQRQIDEKTDANILGLILGDRTRREQVAAIAAARSELGARITEEGQAQTRSVLTLQSRVGAAESQIASEIITRADQFGSLGASIFQVNAALTQEIADREGAVEEVNARVTEVDEASVQRDGATRALITREALALRGTQIEADQFKDSVISGLVQAGRKSRRDAAQIAFVREEFTSQITDLNRGFSSSLFALGLRIGEAEGSIRELDRVVIENNTTLVQSIDTLTLSTTVLSGTVSTISGDLSSTIGRVDTVEGDLDDTKGRVDEVESGLSGVPTLIEGAITSERVLWQEGDSIIAGDLATLTTTVGENTATLVTYGESIDGLLANYGLKIDINGRITGYGVNASPTATIMRFLMDAVQFIDPTTGDVYLGADASGKLSLRNGTIQMDNGTFMLVIGLGFGVDNDFLLWYGPSRAINLCNRADSSFYIDTTGDGEFGLRLGSNFYKNSGTGTSIANNAEIIVGPFVTDGGVKQIGVTYQYRRLVQITDAFAYTGTPQAVLRVERKVGSGSYTTVGDYTFNGTASGEDGFGPSEPGSALIEINGGASFTDTTAGTGDFTYRVSIISRSVGGLTSTVSLEDELRQQVTLISTEQIT